MKKKTKDNPLLTRDKKMILSVMFIVNIALMVFSWFGVNNINIRGSILLYNPLTILSLLMFLWGVWYEFRIRINKLLIFIGILGFLGMQIWYFLTWHLLGYYQYMDFDFSLQLAKPAFFISVLVTSMIILTSIMFTKKYN